GLGEKEIVATMLTSIRNANDPPHKSMPVNLEAAKRLSELAPDPSQRSDDPAVREQQQVQLQRKLVAAATEQFASMSLEDLRSAFVKEASLVQRRTQMEYFKSNNWNMFLQNKSDKEIQDSGAWLGV